MKKPTDYDEVNVSDYIPPAVGGHRMVIKAVREQKSSKGDPMIVVAFDFDKTDHQPEYFSNEFENDIRPEKKWPHAGTSYIMTQDWNDKSKTNRNFKKFITAVERSNNFECEWGSKFCAQFVNKKVGGVFGQVENEYNGKVSMRSELRWFCDYEKADGATVPNPKYLKAKNASNNDDFMDIKDDDPDEIPF